MDNYISANEAFDKLNEFNLSNNPITQEAIEEIIAQLSVADKNATTILYTTGGVYNGDTSMQRYIGNTEAYKFIESPSFTKLIENQISIANNVTDQFALEKMVKDYINGVEKYENFKPTGIKSTGTTGPWADVSRRFASETTGDVIVCIGDIDAASSRILWNTEMPAILEKSSATSINGVAIENYKFLYSQISEKSADTALDRICRTINVIPTDNVDPNFLDDVALYFDESGNIIDLDPAPLEYIKVDDLDSPDDFVRKESKYFWEIDGAQSKGSYKSTSELLKSVNGNIDDMKKLISSVDAFDNDADSAKYAMKVLNSTNNKSVDDAVDILSSCGKNADKAVDILSYTGGDVKDAKKVITATNGNVDDAIDILATTKNVDKSVTILGQVDGNVSYAKKVITAANGNVDDAIEILGVTGSADNSVAILNKVDGNISDAKKVLIAVKGNFNTFPSVDDAKAIFGEEYYKAMKNIDKFNSRVGIAEYRNLGIEIDSTHISNNEGLAKHLREVGADPSKLEHTKITINAAGEIEGVSIKINNNGTLREINLKSPADINAGVLEVTASEYKMMTAIPDESLKLRYAGTEFDNLDAVSKLKFRKADAMLSEKSVFLSLENLQDDAKSSVIDNLLKIADDPALTDKIVLHFNADGNVIDFNLSGEIGNKPDSKFAVRFSDMRNAPSDYKIAVKYNNFGSESLSKLEMHKIRAGIGMYENLGISDLRILVGDSSISGKESGKMVYDHLIKIADNPVKLEQIKLHYNNAGKVVGISTPDAEFTGKSSITISVKEANSLPSDDYMRSVFNNFDDLDFSTKISLKNASISVTDDMAKTLYPNFDSMSLIISFLQSVHIWT